MTNLMLYSGIFFPDEKLQIWIEPRNPCLPYPLHSHDFCELIICFDGSGIHTSEYGKRKIEKGDVFLILPNELHGYEDTNNLNVQNIMCKSELIHSSFFNQNGLPGFHIMFSSDKSIENPFSTILRLEDYQLAHVNLIIDKMLEEIKVNELGYHLMVSSHFIEMVVFLSRCYSNINHSGSLTEDVLARIGDLMNHIEKNYDKKISIKEMMDISYMSASTLYRNFKKTTGYSPANYQLQVRINTACTLIKEKKLNITEIAYQVGFTDSNYFSRQFKKYKNISPTDYQLLME